MARWFHRRAIGLLTMGMALAGASGCAGTTSASVPSASPARVAWFPAMADAPATATANVDPELARLAKNVLSTGDEDEIAALREAGPEGLRALLAVDDGSAAHTSVIDKVARQRDARASGLYWYTDLERAKSAAQREGKPILSLRMLGRLDHKLSCANSRFFRTVLYPNRAVSDYLRQRFVLHWSSERPVPKINIDFGDGRKLETTITGNSIHYVLDQQGRFVDGLPGLYAPSAFVGSLENAARVAQLVGPQDASRRRAALVGFHSEREKTVTAAWRADLAFLGVATAPPVTARIAPPGTNINAPSAAVAVPIAAPKAAAEAPMVAALNPTPQPTLASVTTDPVWEGIAARHASSSQLDRATLDIMIAKSPAGLDPATMAARKDRFQKLLALDTVRNEYLLHRQIHRWVAEGGAEESFLVVNTRVYRELFLTPRSDPYLGLVNPTTYTALENDGLSVQSAPSAPPAAAQPPPPPAQPAAPPAAQPAAQAAAPQRRF